uniref:Ig-like domain-containing protein n=1 Tax=Alistipes sp. TaxID=1872444 RepID=UPI004055A727
MKKVLLFLSCLALFACSESGNDEPAPKPVEQEVSCRITAPEEGFTCYLDEELTIQGEGSVNVGEIESVRLKLNGLVVAELESVPFTYKHTFQPSDKAGEYTLTLTIEGDQGAIKSDSRRITLKERENPTPDPDQEVSCALTAPENGAQYNAGESFTIRGEGEVNVGKIEEVVLRINDMKIEEVNALPFTFTYTFSEEAEAGEYTITLSVKGDQGAEATASRVVTLLEKSNPDPLPDNGEQIDPTPGNDFGEF